MYQTIATLSAAVVVALTLGHAATRTFAEVGFIATSTCTAEGCQ